ncbi:c-type cytochrome biogenesis protein CcmI [Roseovarius sp. M141]|uniref:c-type cytochrome biogenesis protein CcmI n=1 Tax=Roseovarius sp. M141 TaxID=2583806 RepID=UPI0020CE8CBB|nr:c-type cytochrome biogenesis protein CcmI [Roseovarius sp. M141]MCQ0093372.1 c-type cytochrome biogenesis protein CcmI [Roseovarius sp. M141]
MIFWAIAAILALGCSGLIAAALLRRRGDAVPPAAYDLDVYRVQLKDVDKDLARGIITAAEAERLRTEVSRRILSADAQLRQVGAGIAQPSGGAALLAGILALVVTAGALAGYFKLGAPGYADMPRSERLAASDAARADRLAQADAVAQFGVPEAPIAPGEDFAQLMQQLRAAVEKRPDDLRGLTLLARNEAGLGNTSAALDAQTRLIALRGDQASGGDHAFLADLLITAAGGYVSREAEAALRTALSKDPGHPEARYYLGIYYDQVDRPDAAFRTWERLLHDSQPGAAWIAPLRTRIVSAADRAGIRYSLPPLTDAPGPSAQDIDAAGDMTGEERQQMIRGMVDGLMSRLADQGGPPEEWARLIASLGVLGEAGRAAAIRDEALVIFGANPEALQVIRAAAQKAGIPESETAQ